MKKLFNHLLPLLCLALIGQLKIQAQVNPNQINPGAIKIQPNSLQNLYSQRISKAIRSGITFKNITGNAALVSSTENGMSSTITINKTFSFQEAVKTKTALPGTTSQCLPYKINFKKSDIDFSVDATSNSQLRNMVYPGALVNATNLLNGNYSDGLQNPLPLLPMNLSTTMLPLQAGQTSSREITAMSGTNVKNALNEIYLQNAQGGTNSPTVMLAEGYMLESNNQWKVESKHTMDFDISESVKVPLDVISVGAGVGGSASASASGLASLQQQRSYAVMAFKQIYYTATIEPVQPAGTAGATGRYFNTAATNIPEDLLYIKTVDYGRIIYVVVSANASRQELGFALSRKFGANVNMGLTLTGIDLGVTGNENASVSDQITLNKVFQQSQVSFKVIIYGGNPMSLTDLPVPYNDIQNAPDGSPTLLINKIMSQANMNFSTNNVPLPIGFSCCYARDGATAWVNSNINYYSESCSPTIKYDLDLELDNLDFITINSGTFGDHEELYGKLKFTYLKAGSREVNTDRIFWEEAEGAKSYSKGKHQVDKRENIIKNLSFDELRNVNLFLAGELYDDEGILPSRNYKCDNCQDISGNYGKRRVYFIETSSVQTSIAQLKLTGDYQVLKMGDDNFLELNFYESDKKSEGYVKANWKVWIKPHQ